MRLRDKRQELSLRSICIILLFFAGMLYNSAYSQDTLHVHNNIIVPAGEVMHIEPGTVVLFHGYFHISVAGSLIAAGTHDQPILFTVADTTGLYDTHVASGGWNGIRFDTTEQDELPTPSWLSYCTFEFSKASGQDFQNGGAISLEGEKDVTIQNCTFRFNVAYRKGGAIYILENNALITQSHFYQNSAANRESELYAYGGAIYTDASRSTVSWCRFEFNHANGMGGAINLERSHVTLFNNIIQHNDAPLGGGIGIIRTESASVLSNSLITHNTSMFFGGGIAIIDAAMTIANCNILNNYAGYGGGLYFNEESKPKFFNTIIRGNRVYPDTLQQVFIFDGLSAPDFYHCNIEGGQEAFQGPGQDEYSGAYVNNMDADPLFADPANQDFQLMDDSPCIDSGYEQSEILGIHHLDLAHNPRFSGARIDMGAFEFQDPYNYFRLTLSTQGQGTTEPGEGEYILREGAEILLQAYPAEGWVFDHWVTTHGVFNEPVVEFELDQDVDAAAVFQFQTAIFHQLKDYPGVWPNPVTDLLQIRLPAEMDNKEVLIELREQCGRIVKAQLHYIAENPFFIPFDFSKLKKGIYLVTVKEDKYGSEVFKVVK